MLFFAMFLIFARLLLYQYVTQEVACNQCSPVLEPNLNGTLCHVDFGCNSLSGSSSGCGILVEFNFEGDQLILSGALPLLISLLLGKCALARRSAWC